jgi:2-polyprenyl-3-methyl-5-hydroxy-6-metoxy-1,4-benzoquinol methylase
MEYRQQIRDLSFPSFQKIRGIANKSIADLEERQHHELWEKLNHGKDLLGNHELLCQYLWSFGNMHEAKIQRALSSVPKDIFNNDFTIIDWGCGQGLATMCLFDFITQNKIANKVQKVILIEPSTKALERAKLHINANLHDENTIQTVSKKLDEVEPSDIIANV